MVGQIEPEAQEARGVQHARASSHSNVPIGSNKRPRGQFERGGMGLSARYKIQPAQNSIDDVPAINMHACSHLAHLHYLSPPSLFPE